MECLSFVTVVRSICVASAMAALVSAGAVAKSDLTDLLTSPVGPSCVSSPFGPRHLPALPIPDAFHNGIDLPAPIGHPVVAVSPGTVIRVQRKGPGGLELLIQHNGFIGVYSHLGLVAPAIAEGRRIVHAGQKVGLVGRSGLTMGPHLFFAMIVGNQAVDPAPYLGVAPCGKGAGPSGSTIARTLRPTRRYSQAMVQPVRTAPAMPAR
ncbi:MAG TPA: M23 family metallopeptidase [Rhodopila sp.]|nr:M23 family metallopeptidase [Rhodopila sp.]